MDGSLIYRFNQNFIYVDMRRTAGNPNQDFCDVLCGKRLGALIDVLGANSVAFEAYEGELGLCQTRVNRADANAGSIEFQT